MHGTTVITYLTLVDENTGWNVILDSIATPR